MLNPKEIGARIKGLRTLKGMTLEEIASKIQVSRSTILRYERGEFERIKLPMLFGIANALGVSPQYLCQTDDCGLSEALLDFQTTKANSSVKNIELSEQEYALVSAYRIADNDDRAIIDNIVRRYAPSPANLTPLAARGGGLSYIPTDAAEQLDAEMVESNLDL